MRATVEGRILDVGRRGNDLVGRHDELHGFSCREERAAGIERNVDRHDLAGLQSLLPGPLSAPDATRLTRRGRACAGKPCNILA